MRSSHKEKKMLALIFTPLSFLIVGYAMIYLCCQPILRPVLSIYSLIASSEAPNFLESSTILYDENKIEQNEVVYYKDIEWPGVGDQYGEVNIDRLALSVKLFYGDTKNILDYGIGTYTGAFLPGFDRSILMPGHTIPYFKQLGEVVVGDEIRIATHYGEFRYQVTERKVGDYLDENMYDLAQSEKEQLILYTCYPLDGIGFKSERLFIYADKIAGPQLKEGD